MRKVWSPCSSMLSPSIEPPAPHWFLRKLKVSAICVSEQWKPITMVTSLPRFRFSSLILSDCFDAGVSNGGHLQSRISDLHRSHNTGRSKAVPSNKPIELSRALSRSLLGSSLHWLSIVQCVFRASHWHRQKMVQRQILCAGVIRGGVKEGVR